MPSTCKKEAPYRDPGSHPQYNIKKKGQEEKVKGKREIRKEGGEMEASNGPKFLVL